MSFQLNMPPSAVARLAKSAEGQEAEGEVSETKKREDYKKLKELEEARKAGTVPAMQDEDGRDINPHIPQYIMQAPWYFGATTPTLKHQRPQDEKERRFGQMGLLFKKGVIEGSAATKFRKGACENCGAMTHKKKDCLERPRKIGAKFTGSGFAPDEYVPQSGAQDYDGKRDRWNGYDMEQHKRITEEFAKVEEAKKQLRGEKVLQGEVPPEDEDKEGSDEDEDEMKGYADDVAMPGQKFESKQRITVRNLRIREDTAKYLYNLDTNSAYYDPKTRSMRQNPFSEQSSEKAMTFAGDNFVRWSGDAQNIAQRQVFAWEAYEKGAEVHLQADPTKLEILAREFKEKKEKFKDSQKQSILEKYGGEEHLDAPPKQLLLAQTEDYVEYSRTGSVIKGAEKAKVKSMYEEDVYINNHYAVWGSYWKDGKWGFKCCHSLIKESYCTGAAGQTAAKSSLPTNNMPSQPAQPAITQSEFKEPQPVQVNIPEGQFTWKKKIEEEENKKNTEKQKKTKKESSKKKKKNQKKRKTKKKKSKKAESSSDSSSSSSSDSSSSSSDSSSSSSSSSESEDEEEKKRERKIRKAMKAEKARLKEVDAAMALDERKRKYNSMYTDVAPNEEEQEAYKRLRIRSEDPMAQFM